MKKKMMLAVLLAGCVVCATGCSSNILSALKGGQEAVTAEATETPEVTETPIATEIPQETKAPEQTKVPEATPEATKAEETPEETADGSLSAAELEQFTQWAQKQENYGLLMSDYADPHDANLHEIFYTGAGMESRQLTDEETQSYLMSTGSDEIYTDCTVLKAADIDAYLQRKLCVALDDVVASFDWVYLPATDVWVQEHGDTNYTKYECVSGQKTDAETYVLEFAPMESEYYSKCRTTLKKVDGDYQVISNVFI